MAREKENTTIDDVAYVCHMMPATMANKVLVELSGALGHPLLVAIATMFEGGGETEVEHVVDTAMKLVMSRLPPDDADRICKTMLNGVSASGAGPLHELDNFDAHFRGRIFHLWKVVFWSIKVNYRDFFLRREFKPHRFKPGGSSVKWRTHTNCDPLIWRCVLVGESLDLGNLERLQTTMSINDLYDALEAIDVAQENAHLMQKKMKTDAKNG